MTDLEKGFQGVLALLHAGLHVKAASIDDLVGHVNLHLLDVVTHQGLYAVCIPPLAPCAVSSLQHMSTVRLVPATVKPALSDP